VTCAGKSRFVTLMAIGAVLLGACSSSAGVATPSPAGRASAGALTSTAVSRLPPTRAVTSPGRGWSSTEPLSGVLAPEPAPYLAVRPSPGAPPLDFGQPVASLGAVLDNRGRQRVDGEKAARDIAKLFLDSRTSRSGDELLGLISAPTLDAQTRALLVTDYDATGARGGNIGRHCEPEAGAYLRSSFEGPESGPTRVSVNFACFLSSDPLKLRFWYVTGWDVEPSRTGGWQLAGAGFSGAPPPGREAMDMTASARSKLLAGPGWRRLSP